MNHPKPDEPNAVPGGFHHFETLVDRLLEPGVAVLPEITSAFDSENAQLAFQFAMARCLQQGPANCTADHPARLILRAWEAVDALLVSAETAALLRLQLADAGSRLRLQNLWSEAAPLWWEPLPPPSPLESLWVQLISWGQAALDRLAQATQTQGSPGYEDMHDPGFWQIAEVLPDPFLRSLSQTLENPAHQAALALEQVGVGADGVISEIRQDEVCYLRGDEWVRPPGLAQLTMLVRWTRTWLGPRLASVLGRTCQPPQNAMLARYAPGSGGYRAHIDNPGGEDDNGRTLTAILYLNPAGAPPRGGGLRAWPKCEDPSGDFSKACRGFGGDLVCFDARTYVHEVEQVGAGPARWALSLWFNDQQPAALSRKAPTPTTAEMFLGIANPSLPPDSMVCHHLEGGEPSGRMTSYPAPSGTPPRAGIVCTTYRGGAMLRDWCKYHLALGFDHLILVFDRLGEPEEARLAGELTARHGPDKITCLDGETLLASGWPDAARFPNREKLVVMAQSSGHSWSVTARQTLNASHVLTLAKTDRFGGKPLDWLLHLDTDECFHLEGDHRGGARLADHFALAGANGWRCVRYLNNELLLTPTQTDRFNFKINPRLALARLGTRGWASLCQSLAMAQGDQRPYFSGYHNGKSAVAVAHGVAAAGVHGWYTKEAGPAGPVLAGPSVLHFHCANASQFVRKYLDKAKTPPPSEKPLFPPSPLEEAAMEVLHKASKKGDAADLTARLTEVYRDRTHFDADQIQLLQLAGLIASPALPGLDHFARRSDA